MTSYHNSSKMVEMKNYSSGNHRNKFCSRGHSSATSPCSFEETDALCRIRPCVMHRHSLRRYLYSVLLRLVSYEAGIFRLINNDNHFQTILSVTKYKALCFTITISHLYLLIGNIIWTKYIEYSLLFTLLSGTNLTLLK